MRLGGAERFVLDMALALRAAGWDARIWVSEHHIAQTFPEARDGRVPVHAASSWIPPGFAGRPRRGLMLARLRLLLWEIARRPGPPALFVVDDPVHIAAWIRRRWPRVPILVHCNYPDAALPPPANAVHRWYRTRLDRLNAEALAAASEVTAISAFSRAAIQRIWPQFASWAVPVLHPGVAMPGSAALRPPGPEGTILCVSRLDPSKRPDLAIAAFGQLRGMLPAEHFARCRLVLAGGLDVRHGLAGYPQTLMQQAGDAGVAGQVDLRANANEETLARLWAGASVFMHTAPEEHFGIVLIEAMSRALPVLAVNAAGPKEIVVDGVTGALRPFDPDAFATVLAGWMRDPVAARQAGAAGRTRAAELFSTARFQRNFLSVVEALLARSD